MIREPSRKIVFFLPMLYQAELPADTVDRAGFEPATLSSLGSNDQPSQLIKSIELSDGQRTRVPGAGSFR